jgi:tetratricopeptide (TPR) repeat protein
LPTTTKAIRIALWPITMRRSGSIQEMYWRIIIAAKYLENVATTIAPLADYNEAIRVDPKNTLAYNNRGNIYRDRGDNDHAIAEYNEAIRIDPSDVAAYTNRGLVFERLGKVDEARADFHAALGMPQKFSNGKWAHDTAEKHLAALQNAQRPTAPPGQTDATRQIRKYRPSLTPEQIAHPSGSYQQFLVALTAYDEDLVKIAFARFTYDKQRLEWLEKAQQQRDVNNINRTKPLIYPVR